VGDACVPATRVVDIELFYAGRFGDAPDPSFDCLAAGSTSTANNMTNYLHGITGIRVFFDSMVTFTGAPEAAFTFEWTSVMGTTFSPVTDAATAITVTEAEQGGVTVVTIVLEDDHVRRRWLKVAIDASQVLTLGVALDGELFGNPVILPGGDGTPGADAVFHIGNLPGNVDGDYRTLVADAGTTRLQVNPFLFVPITNIYDMNKDQRVLVDDAGEARIEVNPFFALPEISP
jgi:hypothetical protein